MMKQRLQTTVPLFRWVLTAMGVIGAFLNALGNRTCFVIWIVANIGWITVNLQRRSWPEVALFSVYLGTAVLGLVTWRMQ